MLELIILLGAGIVFIVLFLFWALSQQRTAVGMSRAHESQLLELVSLSGTSYERVGRLFDPTDYTFLTEQPDLREAARQFERDRRSIALLWLRLLREDFDKLKRFHRALVACGARTDLRTEFRLWVEGSWFRFLHPLMTLWIRVFGLYTVPRTHQVLLGSVRQAASLLAGSLARLSPAQWAELKQFWNAQELKVSLGKL